MSVLSLHWCWVVQNTLSIVPASLGELDHRYGRNVGLHNNSYMILIFAKMLGKVYVADHRKACSLCWDGESCFSL